MYKSNYKYTGTKYNNCIKLLFKDTDSLVHEIETNGVYEDFYENKNLFDFSDYPKDWKIFDSVNEKVIGNMKDEVKRKIISEFVGLKSKMYYLIVESREEIKKAKVSMKIL